MRHNLRLGPVIFRFTRLRRHSSLLPQSHELVVKVSEEAGKQLEETERSGMFAVSDTDIGHCVAFRCVALRFTGP